MKTLYLSLLFLSFLFTAAGQISHLDTLYKWKERQGDMLKTIPVFYKIAGDTLINSKIYMKVHWSVDDSIYHPPSQFVREDSANRIYFIYGFSGNEQLIYDFGFKNNDSFKLKTYSIDKYLRVKYTDSIFLEGKKKKRIVFNNFYGYDSSEVWIEGIGSNFGLMDHIGRFSADLDATLICVTKNNSLIYRNPGFEDCNPKMSALNEPKIETQLKIYPIPATNEINMVLPGINSYEIVVTDQYGKKVFNLTVKGNTAKFKRGNIKAGVYYYVIRSRETVYTGKIIFN